MGKTPSYVKDAVNNYRKKFDIVQVRLDKGTVARIKKLGLNTNQLINELVTAKLDRLESDKKEGMKRPKQQSNPLPEEIEGKKVYKFYNEEDYIKPGEWWREIIFFADDMELNDLFIKFLENMAKENSGFQDGCRLFYDLVNQARATSKYSDKALLEMSDEEMDKIPDEDLELIDQTGELKELLRKYIYNGEEKPLFEFIGAYELSDMAKHKNTP